MKRWLVPVMLCLLPSLSWAQRTELGFQLGLCNYIGDLAPAFQLQEKHPTYGIHARFNLNHSWALTTEYNHYTVSGHDANFDFNKVRNLSFQSDINEMAFLVEFNYLKYSTHVLHENFTSYLYLGVGAFTYNPQAYMDNTWYNLRDYRTENVYYKKFSMAVPFGIGVKYMMSKRFALVAQLGFRKTFTDYLDDVSTVYPDIEQRFATGGLITAKLTDRSIETYGIPQFKNGYKRGDPTHKDWYTSLTIGCSFRLRSRMKCARFF